METRHISDVMWKKSTIEGPIFSGFYGSPNVPKYLPRKRSPFSQYEYPAETVYGSPHPHTHQVYKSASHVDPTFFVSGSPENYFISTLEKRLNKY
jgi:hypothetical protein